MHPDPRITPQRLRTASMVTVAIAGAATGLLGGVGWQLFVDGSQRLAIVSWVLGVLAVSALLLTSAVCRAVAHVLERDASRRSLSNRVRRLEDEIIALRAASETTPPVVLQRESAASVS